MNEQRLIDADDAKKRLLSYYQCVNENTSKSNYTGETLMSYEVADMIEDCIENAPTIDPETLPVVRELREKLEWVTKERDDYKIFFENITKYGDCNDCGKFVTCEFVPKVGQTTRYNCPLWTGR